jgi:hypothetical protein
MRTKRPPHSNDAVYTGPDRRSPTPVVYTGYCVVQVMDYGYCPNRANGGPYCSRHERRKHLQSVKQVGKDKA